MNKLFRRVCFLCFTILVSTDCIIINEIRYNTNIDRNKADEDYEFDNNIQNELESFLTQSAYPNPFNPITNSNLDIYNSDQYEIMIYSLRGQIIYIHQEQYDFPGEYTFSLDADNYVSETYIATINNGLHSVAKKFTFIKQDLIVIRA